MGKTRARQSRGKDKKTEHPRTVWKHVERAVTRQEHDASHGGVGGDASREHVNGHRDSEVPDGADRSEATLERDGTGAIGGSEQAGTTSGSTNGTDDADAKWVELEL